MKHLRGALLSIFLTTGLLFLYYSHQIINADHISYGQWGDGYKNYYTLAYYIKYDSGAHFSGMNYPYGENIMFTDNQPVIAWTFKAISKVFPEISNHIHGYISWVFFLSVIISSFLIYKILIEFRVSELNAVLFAVVIAMLAPQFERLNSHFSLEYTCYIPLLFLLLIKFFKTNGSLTVLSCLLFTLIFFSFIHLYYLAMAAMFILLITLVFSVEKIREIKKHTRFISLLLASAVIPFVILKIFFLLTDHVTDRPQTPWGFISSRSTVADIIFHPYSFTGSITKLFPPGVIVYHGEGSGYIGMVTTVVLLAAIVLLIKNIMSGKKYDLNLYPFNYFVIPAILVLLFAMAFPFSIQPFEDYYEKMPTAFKQFRASGRFNWIFFYMATIFSAIFIDRLFRKLLSGKKIRAYTLLIAVYAVWGIEINMISNGRSDYFNKNTAKAFEKDESKVLAQAFVRAGISPANFQAILPLPFFLNGSEKLYLTGGEPYKAMKASLFTGLPIACGEMSRTSLSQTLEIANLLGDGLIRKDIIHKYPSNKPLLLMAAPDDDLNPAEQNITKQAKFLFALKDQRYYELPLSAFDDTINAVEQDFAANKARLLNHGDYFSYDTVNNIIVKGFEDRPIDYAIFGKGSFYLNTGEQYFYDGALPHAKDSTLYELSAWLYSDNRTAAYPVIFVAQSDSAGKELSNTEVNGTQSTNTFGKWVRVENNFILYNKTNKIKVSGTGKYATFDEVMIRPKNTPVITQLKNDSTFMFDNYPIYVAGF